MIRQVITNMPIKLKSMGRPFYIPFEKAYNKLNNYKLENYYKYFSPFLEKLKDIHRGERCFIIATGPSLNNTDLNLIKDEALFGVNTLYRGLSKFKIRCKYYAISDEMVWKTHNKGILRLDTILFIGSDAGKNYLFNTRYYKQFQRRQPLVIRKLGNMEDNGCISSDISKGLYDGHTIIQDVCLQATYHMGFEEVYLLGCDCDYTGLHRFDGLPTECQPEYGAVITGDFSPVFANYKLCKEFYEKNGREIINATVGGKLEIFKRKKLEDII